MLSISLPVDLHCYNQYWQCEFEVVFQKNTLFHIECKGRTFCFDVLKTFCWKWCYQIKCNYRSYSEIICFPYLREINSVVILLLLNIGCRLSVCLCVRPTFWKFWKMSNFHRKMAYFHKIWTFFFLAKFEVFFVKF